MDASPHSLAGLDPATSDSLSASLRWTRFRVDFVAALTAHLPPSAAARVDLRAVSTAFWAWGAVLEHDASFEALDAVDYAHFAAGQLLSRLLVNRPIIGPGLSTGAEVRVLTEAVIDRLQGWRRAQGAPGLESTAIDVDGAPWASFLENTAGEPELAVAFLDEFTGREPAWRYPQLIAERPAMRRARQRERGGDEAGAESTTRPAGLGPGDA